ncbi:VWA domain-containing protein [Salinibacterium sp. dk2585]|uniref:substrate-binding domain-containing protein n=1 Tax=unclassified Salinibacterium TaxID=2632331 RepID=UPI0011C24A5E|nr:MULTISPECIES: substrate-binding domain-containing protein [unclassified Salinibacterium]QEE61894.1 VWA domain-containing protein [Salinibacterium sp. dk2585]TXK54551.1 VWA domain-containing protein [Salinibacterium sp. dk5596]
MNTRDPYDGARRRHRAPAPRTPRNLLSPIAAAAAVLILVTGAGVAISQGGLASIFAANASGGLGCTDPVELVVVTDTSIHGAMTNVAKDFDANSEVCVSTEVRAQSSGDTAALLASNALADADAWVPDSSLWIARMNSTAEALGRTKPVVEPRASVASSPVVLAAPAARSAEFAADQVGWSTLLAGLVGGVVPDPESSSASLAALASMTAVAPADDPRRLPSTMIELGKTIPNSKEEAVASALEAPAPTVVVMSERDVVAHNEANADAPVIALYPNDGTSALDYPFVDLTGNKPASNERDSLLAAFEEAARLGGAFYMAEGFRDHAGAGELKATGVLPISTSVPPAAVAEQQVAALTQWSSLTRRSRMLVAVDVSGSMLEPAGNGLRRIDVYQRAAGGSLGRYGGEAHMGVWVFSTNRAGDQDWEELVPVGALGNADHRAQIANVTATLPQYIRGDTGLYDTILAGVKHMKEGFVPGMVNSMVIITDGRNDDSNSITLEALLAELTAMHDPLKPVPVILIGFGPDTEIEPMQQIAAVTGGGAFSAYEPNDLDKVFVDAFTQRTCRPTC